MQCPDPITDEKSVLLYAHNTPSRDGLTRARVAIYSTPTSGCYQVFITDFIGTEPIATVRVNLEDVNTEYVTAYYAAIQAELSVDMNPETPFLKQEDLTPSAPATLPQGRKADTSLEQVRPYFSYPINEASKRLGICSTSLKKICRAHGLKRWPYRQVKSVETKMAVSNCPSPLPAQPQTPPQHDPLSLDGLDSMYWDAAIPEVIPEAITEAFTEPAPVLTGLMEHQVDAMQCGSFHHMSRFGMLASASAGVMQQ